MKIMFIAYFYPPIAGTGLPGVQRILRLLRYLRYNSAFVLTVKEEKYPGDVIFDYNSDTNIPKLKVFRTGTIDIFKRLNSLAKKIKKFIYIKPSRQVPLKHDKEVKKKSFNQHSNFQQAKDLISSLMCFPDFAYPWLIPAIYRGICVAKKENPDIIFASGMPWTSLIIGSIVKLFGKGRLVIDFRDPWVGNPYIKKARFLKTLDRLVERFVVKKADLIVANTEQLKEEMLERYPDRNDSMMVLPNSFDPMNFIDLPKLSLNRNKLIIAHAGFLYLGRDPIDILNALSDLIKNKIDIAQQIEFHQIGKIQLEYDLNEKTTEMMIEKQVVNAGQMDHRQCLGYLSMADVLILIQPNTNTQIPSKLYEYIYLEKPIISVTNKDGALGRMILNNKLGMVFEPGDHKGLSTCLTHMVHAKKAGNQILAEYGKTKDKFDARYVTRQLSERLTSVA